MKLPRRDTTKPKVPIGFKLFSRESDPVDDDDDPTGDYEET